MKASEMIKQLEQLILEHGDLPLSMIEISESGYRHAFIEVDGVESIHQLLPSEKFYDSDDKLTEVSKVFLID